MKKKGILFIIVIATLTFWGVWFEIEFKVFSNEFLSQRKNITQSICNKKDENTCMSTNICVWLDQADRLLLDCGFSSEDYCGPPCVSIYSDISKLSKQY